ncbi:MAG: FliH/SctL family protein [Eubacteriales bacterium]
MIKIPLSYKIIKNDIVHCDEESLSIIDTKVKEYPQPPTHKASSPYALQEEIWDYDAERKKIKDEITKELAVEKEKMLQALMEECNILKETAVKEGYQKGYQQGIENGIHEGMVKAKEEAAIIKNNAVSMIEQAQREVKEYFTENRKELIQLAIDMAESVIHTHIDNSSENMMLLIKPILQQYGKKENIIISCHPDNTDFVKGNLYEIQNLCPGTKVFILENKNLEKNGCMIENEHQIIDLQIKRQLSNIVSLLTQME